MSAPNEAPYGQTTSWNRQRRRDLNALSAAIDERESIIKHAPAVIEMEYKAMLDGARVETGKADSLAADGRAESERERRKEWLALALNCIAHAKVAREAGALDQGWFHLQAASRCEVFWAPEEQLATWIGPLRHEAEKKLTGWRKLAVRDLLGNNDVKSISRYSLHGALHIRDGDAGNQYRKVALLKDKLRLLAVLLLLLLFVFVGLSILGVVPIDESGASISTWQTLLVVVLLGAVAGGLSAIMPLSLKNNRGSVPEQLMSWSVTSLRPLIGAAAALGAFAFMKAGIVTIGNGDPNAMWATAFIAGFSEKWILGTIARVTGATESNSEVGAKASPPADVPATKA